MEAGDQAQQVGPNHYAVRVYAPGRGDMATAGRLLLANFPLCEAHKQPERLRQLAAVHALEASTRPYPANCCPACAELINKGLPAHQWSEATTKDGMRVLLPRDAVYPVAHAGTRTYTHRDGQWYAVWDDEDEYGRHVERSTPVSECYSSVQAAEANQEANQEAGQKADPE